MSNETLIRCCAPTMACLKTGNMFTWNQRLSHKGLRILPLRWRDGKALLYLYRPKLLERDLRDPLSRKLLSECGYTGEGASICLARLISRLRTEEDFPHEVGLFLGYPPADVDGFMHRKDECKLSGLWKVYDDVESAIRQFKDGILMSKVAVIYWSGTGNTEAMAQAVAEGAKAAGAEADLLTCSEVNGVEAYDAVALGCPAMGAEELEDSEFLPMLESIEAALPGKKTALFGSYGWGDGEWMRSWEARCTEKGITLAADSVTVNETPDEDGLAACKALGAALA